MRHVSRTTTALAASILILGACGGDDDAAVPSTVSVTAATSTSTVSGATTSTSPSGEAALLPVVVDTDLASDDLVALLYLLSDPTIDVEAVTVAGTGEVTCPRGTEVARGLLAAVGHLDVPVACGQSAPLSGDRVFPEEWRMAADAAYGLSLPVVAPAADEQDAVTLLADTVAAAPSPITLLTLGPLTNVAQAFAAAPGLVDDLAGVVIMGGAVDVPGNVQPEGAAEPLAAEWNLYIDPDATAAVVASGAPVTLVSLDATNQVPITSDFVDRLEANDVTQAMSLVRKILAGRTPPFLWDTLAAIATAHPDLVPSSERTIAVVTAGDDAGRTVEQPDGSAVLVAGPPDTAAVLDHLLRTLSGLDEDEQLATPTTVPVVGEATVSFDGTTCTYDGPTSLPPGALVVTQVPGPVMYWVLVAHLVEGATVDEALGWQADHPGEQPPMVDAAEAIGPDALLSPASIELQVGQNPVVCSVEDGSVVAGGAVTVDAGS